MAQREHQPIRKRLRTIAAFSALGLAGVGLASLSGDASPANTPHAITRIDANPSHKRLGLKEQEPVSQIQINKYVTSTIVNALNEFANPASKNLYNPNRFNEEWIVPFPNETRFILFKGKLNFGLTISIAPKFTQEFSEALRIEDINKRSEVLTSLLPHVSSLFLTPDITASKSYIFSPQLTPNGSIMNWKLQEENSSGTISATPGKKVMHKQPHSPATWNEAQFNEIVDKTEAFFITSQYSTQIA